MQWRALNSPAPLLLVPVVCSRRVCASCPSCVYIEARLVAKIAAAIPMVVLSVRSYNYSAMELCARVSGFVGRTVHKAGRPSSPRLVGSRHGVAPSGRLLSASAITAAPRTRLKALFGRFPEGLRPSAVRCPASRGLFFGWRTPKTRSSINSKDSLESGHESCPKIQES